MFSSFFTTVDPTAQNIHPITSSTAPADFCGELSPDDFNWSQSGGFVSETQTWYHILDDGSLLMSQVIYSSVGLWYPTVQFVTRYVNGTTRENTWRSTNVNNFVSPPPNSTDKKSSKSDQFTIKFSDAGDSINISGAPAEDLQLTLDIDRAAPGFKIGNGPKGGFSNFGPDVSNPEGYVVHHFWPRTKLKGVMVLKGQAISVNGTGMFVHAIQGMRPDHIASRWNFLTFQSEEAGGVSAVMMEFTTTDAHGKKGNGSGGVTVNVGGLVTGGKLVAVTGETKWPGEPLPDNAPVQSRAEHLDANTRDPDTGYSPPSQIAYNWAGPSLLPESKGSSVIARLLLDVGTVAEPKGLVEKVDFLAHVPKIVKN
ncbi:putative cell survival pathways protein, partial [Tulasnella sp. 418]